MKTAMVDGQPTLAGPDAPPVGVCPDCGHEVRLRQRLGTWHWRHVNGVPLECPARFNAHSSEMERVVVAADDRPFDGDRSTGSRQSHDRPFDGTHGKPFARDEGLVERLEEVREMLRGVNAEQVWILCGRPFGEAHDRPFGGADGGLFLVTCLPDRGENTTAN